ncbi:CAP domain-containing protein [Natrononativus amylolyticus]|uniref:CAP domain-containing protein n=1 Tax=Natrononativus amylolyticus TaxID=2963434 RepID=UPI0020CD823A|nr:CAP domain-containing protein [Natrononativus amylolyticus]
MAGHSSDESGRQGPSDTAAPSRRPRDRPSRRALREDRASLVGVVRFLVVALVVCSLAVGVALVGPQLAGELEELDGFDRLEEIDRLDGIDRQPSISPSADPPPAGERNPELTDPDDPGVSAYETDVERITSEAVEDFVHAGVNDRRAEHGLEPIEWDGTVASVSRAHSVDMAAQEGISHVNSEGESPYDRFNDVADYCRAYGENVAMTWVDRPVRQSSDGETVSYYTAEELADGLVEQWMNSPDHRAAILEEDVEGWDRGGVGVYVTEEGQVFATHNFCTEW